LHRSRDDLNLPDSIIRQSVAGFQLDLPADWLLANPLSAAALADEALIWQRMGLALRIRRRTAISMLE
jgi:exopolyphosphatase/guanosine-5'-triphosphate,3'-diphosphate pyrophosphatase